MTNSSLGQTVTCDSQELHRPSIRDPKIHFPNHTILRNWLTGMQQWKCLSEQSASQHLLKGNSNRTLKAVLPEEGSTNSVQKYTPRQLRGLGKFYSYQHQPIKKQKQKNKPKQNNNRKNTKTKIMLTCPQTWKIGNFCLGALVFSSRKPCRPVIGSPNEKEVVNAYVPEHFPLLAPIEQEEKENTDLYSHVFSR